MAHLFAVIMLLSCVVAGVACQRTDAVLRVLLKPLHGSRKFLYVRKRQDVTLKCDPINIDSVGYYWTHNGVALKNDTSDQLFISGQDEGTYNCLVDTGQGSLLSETLIVKLAEIKQVLGGRPGITFKNVNTLPCDVTGLSVPRGHVTWTRGNKGRQEFNISDNKHIDLSGTLIFLYKKSDDQNKAYQCHVENSFLNATISGNITYLQDSTGRQQTGPRLVRSSHALRATEGDDIILECVFEGDPLPHIKWERRGRPLRENRKYNFSTFHRRLEIAELSMRDSGEYICIANNTKGTVRATITLSVIERPRAVDPPKSMTVLNGTNVTYSCATNPTHKVSWFINGMLLKADDKYLLRKNETELTIIPSAHEKDDLCVQCNITDGNSYTMYSACIHYVDTEEELPTTTTTAVAAVTNGSKAGVLPETQSPPSELTTIVIHVVIGVVIAIVLIVVTVVIIIIARRECNRKKTRLSIVGSEIPKRSSLFWETQFFVTKRKNRFPSKTCKDEEDL